MEVSRNNGTRFREKEVNEFEIDVLVCYQRGVGEASKRIWLFSHVLIRRGILFKMEKARFDGSDMFCRPRKNFD